MKIPTEEIQIKDGRRELDADHVRELADSIRELGLLNPITVDKEHTLIAGLHRLEAVKLLEWPEIECTVSSLDGLRAELAEIDENIVRHDLDYLEEGEQLARRKEIYEALHPETQQGKRNGQTSKTATVAVLETKPFAADASEKTGMSERTIRQKIQVAKKLTPETKEIAKDGKIGFRNAVKLSGLEPAKQKEVAALLAEKKIKSVDEYTAGKTAEPKEPAPEPAHTSEGRPEPEAPAIPHEQPEKTCSSFKEVVADLKDTEKEYNCTPDMFLTEYSNFARKLVKEMEWYESPLYEAAFPYLSAAQLDLLRQQTDSICHAAEELFSKVERTKQL